MPMVSMRAGPGQKLLIEIPSHANTYVVGAVQEVVYMHFAECRLRVASCCLISGKCIQQFAGSPGSSIALPAFGAKRRHERVPSQFGMCR